MTPLEGRYNSVDVDRGLKRLVKLEWLMKKHFVYTDDIDELKQNDTVVRDFDNAIGVARTLIRKLRNFRSSLANQ